MHCDKINKQQFCLFESSRPIFPNDVAGCTENFVNPMDFSVQHIHVTIYHFFQFSAG